MVISFIDLIYMIGQSISKIAFDMELVIKNIHNHSTLDILHDKINGTVFYEDNF